MLTSLFSVRINSKLATAPKFEFRLVQNCGFRGSFSVCTDWKSNRTNLDIVIIGLWYSKLVIHQHRHETFLDLWSWKLGYLGFAPVGLGESYRAQSSSPKKWIYCLWEGSDQFVSSKNKKCTTAISVHHLSTCYPSLLLASLNFKKVDLGRIFTINKTWSFSCPPWSFIRLCSTCVHFKH